MHTRRRKRSFAKKPLWASAEAKLKFLEELVPQLARAIAPICEVVLHENTSSPPTIRAIGNGQVTNRSVGDLMTQIFVNGENASNRDTPLFNYVSTMPDGRQIRVSLIPVFDEDEVIGYIAVNFLIHDLAVAVQALSVLARAEPHAEAIQETFTSPREVIEKIVDEYLHMSGRPVALLDKRERIELVRLLRDRGVFRMRGAVDEVTQLVGVSRTAVYNYLSEADRTSEL